MVDTCSELKLLKLQGILQVGALSSSHGDISHKKYNWPNLISVSAHTDAFA